ncbi:ChuX/HutX family heme-like substrate-binding protein [Vagococcus sp. WN89Y]|uniref:ChuX/HutX family heme-like substrate-binding protein n=1 Tax=Vagococcus sp. WN89Y TaxID=3457258 RepID=UPI003FCEE467
MINASGRADYSINNTSQDWGIDNTPSTSQTSLAKIFSFIKKISPGTMEVTTNGPSAHSLMRVQGKIAHPSANGHLILNPNGVDLRIIAGEIDHVMYDTLSEGNFKASFRNKNSETVLTIHFPAKEKPCEGTTAICSRQIKRKAFDSDKSIETLWRNMTDVHHFYPMLKQFNISKLDAFRSVPEDLAVQVTTQSVMTVLKTIEKEHSLFMAFVGNDAVIQVYTGPIRKLVHLKAAEKLVVHGVSREGESAVIKIALNEIDQAWVVNKNSTQGFITSLEIFDKDSNHIVQFYGKRAEGEKQDKQWAALMHSLPRAPART